MCLEIYELEPIQFFNVTGLEWQTALKKIKVKLHLLTDIDVLSIVETFIRGGICHAIRDMQKLIGNA